jgi:hypothetical protein
MCSYLHFEVELNDGDVGQDGIGQHVPGIVHGALLGPGEELLLTHARGNVLERLLLSVHIGPMALLCTEIQQFGLGYRLHQVAQGNKLYKSL